MSGLRHQCAHDDELLDYKSIAATTGGHTRRFSYHMHTHTICKCMHLFVCLLHSFLQGWKERDSIQAPAVDVSDP